MNRRKLLALAGISLASIPLITSRTFANKESSSDNHDKIVRTDAEWKKILTPAQYPVLREGGTEPAHSSPLNNEKRQGQYVCAACESPLFSSEMKYDSGTGWPSFYTTLPNAMETKTDFRMFYPRTEYHCARCGGHHGHVFKDGPKPTGQRWCNNGLVLKFIPA